MCRWAGSYRTNMPSTHRRTGRGGGGWGRRAGEAGEVAADVVAAPLRRGQIQVDVAVFAPDEPGRPRPVLSLGEATWDKGHGYRPPRAAAPGPRPARRERVRHGADETNLLQRGALRP